MQQMPSRISYLFLFITTIIAMGSCRHEDYYPKPRAYFRLDMPEHSYRQLDSTFPFTFEYSKHAQIQADKYTRDHPYWFNIAYPGHKAKVHFSYKKMDSATFPRLRDDAHNMAYKHAPKAIGLGERKFENPDNKVYGLAYTIEGKEVASPYQFFLTDSSRHFVRAALYFELRPNNDSLRPVIDYIVEDMNHLISTLQWK